MRNIRVIAVFIVLCLLGGPTLSFAKAGGSYRGGGGYSGSKGGGMSSGSMGSRGSRTHDQNGYKPIERSTTPAQPSTAPPASRANSPQGTPSQPVSQPSFLQRHPLLSGLAAGIAGSWIGHLLFGATDSSARSNDGAVNESPGESDNPGGASGSMGMVLLLMALGAGALYYFFKTRRTHSPVPAFSGLQRGHAGLETMPGTLQPASRESLRTSPELTTDVTPADEEQFRDLLVQIQTAWGRQDLDVLRKVATPEMLHYFSNALAENVSQGVENRVEDVMVMHAEIREAWTEDARMYATVSLRWKVRDYTVSLAKQAGEPGYLIEGDERLPTETTEAWTFVRHQNGKWLLSAIQQVE